MTHFLGNLFTPACGAAFAVGAAGHFLFDVFSYAAIGFAGFKIGHRCHHKHTESK